MIRGIDNQVLMNRVTEYTKDASTQIRRDAIDHDFSKTMVQTQAEQAQKRVTNLEQKDGPRVKNEDKEKSKKRDEQQHASSEQQEDDAEEFLMEGMLVEPFAKKRIVRSKIDIKV